MRLWPRKERTIVVLLLLFSLIPMLGGSLRIVELIFDIAVIPENSRAIAAPLPIMLHVIGSLVFCGAGAFQFLPSIRRNNIALHRSLGKLVAMAGLLSAASGLWMTVFFEFPAQLQGGLLYWTRIFISAAMAWFIMRAVVAVRSGNLVSHRSSMIRAYALAQGASTQAFLGIGWILLFGADLIGPERDAVMVSAWCINILVAEILILQPGKRSHHKVASPVEGK